MRLEQFELHNLTLTYKSGLLFKSAKALFENSDNIFIKSLSEKIPSCLIQDEKINIVFVGQYSSGKSSLIKALTENENIKISASITTEKTEFYDWNDIIICDTPGIHTGIRPDHDEIAYDAISKANLVVFVITNELFDSQLIEIFKKLAIDLGKSHEMMLVVNKMGRHEKGNTREAQEIVFNEIKRMIVPILPEDLYISFLNIESIFEAKKKMMMKLNNI